MATATEIATSALRRIGICDALSTPSAADIASATDALGAMIAGWEAEGYSGDILPLDSRFEHGIVALLAVRIAEDYGKSPGPVLLRDAMDGERRLMAHFFVVPQSTFDSSLGGSAGSLNGRAWEANTEYLPRQRRTNGQNLYEVVTGGVSGTTGPDGTGASIVDGTVVWCWRGVSE